MGVEYMKDPSNDRVWIPRTEIEPHQSSRMQDLQKELLSPSEIDPNMLQVNRSFTLPHVGEGGSEPHVCYTDANGMVRCEKVDLGKPLSVDTALDEPVKVTMSWDDMIGETMRVELYEDGPVKPARADTKSGMALLMQGGDRLEEVYREIAQRQVNFAMRRTLAMLAEVNADIVAARKQPWMERGPKPALPARAVTLHAPISRLAMRDPVVTDPMRWERP